MIMISESEVVSYEYENVAFRKNENFYTLNS